MWADVHARARARNLVLVQCYSAIQKRNVFRFRLILLCVYEWLDCFVEKGHDTHSAWFLLSNRFVYCLITITNRIAGIYHTIHTYISNGKNTCDVCENRFEEGIAADVFVVHSRKDSAQSESGFLYMYESASVLCRTLLFFLFIHLIIIISSLCRHAKSFEISKLHEYSGTFQFYWGEISTFFMLNLVVLSEYTIKTYIINVCSWFLVARPTIWLMILIV